LEELSIEYIGVGPNPTNSKVIQVEERFDDDVGDGQITDFICVTCVISHGDGCCTFGSRLNSKIEPVAGEAISDMFYRIPEAVSSGRFGSTGEGDGKSEN
jgi:hypothetical protein